MAQDSAGARSEGIPGIDYQREQASRTQEPENGQRPAPDSYSMLEPRMKAIYGQFYKETYFSENKHLDTRTQELIAIACSVVAKCEGCLDGHLTKALQVGATKEEISESIVIAIGIAAAAIVDQTDKSAARLGLNHFPLPAKKKD